jgi:hypothetical protein
MPTSDNVEFLISHLSGPLEPADRLAFRRAVQSALAASQDWGDGSAYRAVVELWRPFFHPPPDMTHEANQAPRRSKLVDQPAIARSSRRDEL